MTGDARRRLSALLAERRELAEWIKAAGTTQSKKVGRRIGKLITRIDNKIGQLLKKP
jgi:hypothetical protein